MLGMCYKTAGWYLWKKSNPYFIFYSAVLVRTPNKSITRFSYSFRHTNRGRYFQILAFEIRGGKLVLEQVLRDIASKRRDMSGCCLWDPLLDRSNCYNSSYGILHNQKKPTHQPTNNQPTNKETNQPNYQQTQPTNQKTTTQATNEPSNQPTNQPTN